MCDGRDENYLRYTIIGSSGRETGGHIDVGNAANCKTQLDLLVARRSKVSPNTLFAICDSNLHRFMVTASGELKELEFLGLYDYDKCMQQAKVINEN